MKHTCQEFNESEFVPYSNELCRACQSESGKHESAWVIEADGSYWTGTHVDSRGFQQDVNEAVRFARFEDAEKVKHWLMPTLAFALKAVEHVWVDSAQ